MLLSGVVLEQIERYRSHCRGLQQRLARLTSDRRMLCAQLNAIAARKNVSLFFLINARGRVSLLSTNDCQSGASAESRIAPDAGRHYFATVLYQLRFSELFIDMFLRHAEVGVEALSSTSVTSLREARQKICPAIDAELARLGISAARGLGQTR